MQSLIKERLAENGIFGKVQYNGIEAENSVVRITKKFGDHDFTRFGAVPEGDDKTELVMAIEIPRCAGACGVKLCLSPDGEDASVFELESSTNYVTDRFELSLTADKLPGKLANGLYYYHFEISFGSFTLYTKSINNADFALCENYPETSFRLLVYDKDYETPEWFKGNIMYHVFVDRFFKGSETVPVSETAIVNPDWENGIPQYAEYPGAFLENNVFFGGTLFGVCEKLDYLQSLGVGCIYLSPIFKAYSNHKYDTGDYMQVDEMFGSDKALAELISEAKKRDIKIVLDGVFNHTGDDSKYFNRYGRYDGVGAYGNEDSPYRDWYTFSEDGVYQSWWGIEILPKLRLDNPECREYFLGKKGVIAKYFDMGIGGIRLDVADELPEDFLEGLRDIVRQKNPDGLIIGEVWENAADKISYGKRRKYFRGKSLDSVMNYPQKNAVIEFIKNGNAEFFYNMITELYASYPKQCSDVLMNIVGTHDTDRIITVLAGDCAMGLTHKQLAEKRMTKKQRVDGVRKLKAAAAIQYTLFGSPSVYYGDETGLEGYGDPFCRMPYPWHKQDTELVDYYRKLGNVRREEKLFRDGDFIFTEKSCGFVAYKRFCGEDEILVMANVTDKTVERSLGAKYKDLMTGKTEKDTIKLPYMTVKILKKI